MMAYATVEPIANLAEFKGKKIRATGWSMDFTAALGASPVPTPFGEMYSALATGVLDGITTPWDAMLGMKIYEQAPYLILPNLSAAPGLNILIGMDQWNALPDDLRMIVQLTGRNWASWHSRWYSPRNMPSAKAMEAVGWEFVTWPEEDMGKWSEASMAIWDDVAAKDPVAAEAIRIMKDYFKEIGKPGF